MSTKPKSDTPAGTASSGNNQTRDYDDDYGAGAARETTKRSDGMKYNDKQPRVGGRARADKSKKD